MRGYSDRGGALRMSREIIICDECESEYFADTSGMEKLCPDCSHVLYGHPNCQHSFKNEKCTKCYWNGRGSDYTDGLKIQTTDK